MTARLLDGKAAAAELNLATAQEAARFQARYGRQPGLAAVLTGDDPASAVYVKNKATAAQKAGLSSRTVRLPAEVTQAQLLAAIAELNADETVDGMIVQLPLPAGLNAGLAVDAVSPEKDADGFHPLNVGKLSSGRTDGLIPCTPYGCMTLIRSCLPHLSGKRAVVLGRSDIVGKPMAALLLAADCTVTIAHSRTPEPERLCAEADIVVAAVGRPGLVRGHWIKPGATVIDVGINRVTEADGTSFLRGDVLFEEAAERAAFITPVPGGVGPMTVACLMRNTVIAAFARKGDRIG